MKTQEMSLFKLQLGMNAKRQQGGIMDTIQKQPTLLAERLQTRYLRNCGDIENGYQLGAFLEEHPMQTL